MAAREILIAGIILSALALVCSPLHGADYTTTPLLDPAGVLQVYPWVHFNGDQLGRGHFPLWNHLTGLGQPHLANIQTALFYPLYWAWYAVGGENAYGALMIFRLWLAAMLWFCFARARTASFAGALVTGAAYGMGGYALWFAQLIDLNSQLLLPALLLVWGALWARPRARTMIGAAALVALVIFGGHPEAAFITLFVGLAYTATMAASMECAGSTALCSAGGLTPASQDGTPRQAAAEKSAVKPAHSKVAGATAVAASLAIGGMLSLGATVPFLDYLSRCWSLHGSGFGFIHLDPRGFFNLILPGVHQLFNGMPTELPVAATTLGVWDAFTAAYRATAAPGNLPGAGLVVVGLALVAMARPRRLNRHALFFVGLLAFTLGLTFGLPFFRLVAFVPPFNLNSNFKFFFSEIHASLAVLAGVGFDRIWPIKTAKPSPYLIILAALAFIIVSSVGTTFDSQLALYISIALILIVSVMAWSHMRSSEKNHRVLVVIVIFGSLLSNSELVVPFVRLHPEPRERKKLAANLRSTAEQRMQAVDGFWPANLSLVEGIKDIRSSDALYYKPYIDLINRVNDLSPEKSLSYFYPSYYTQISPEKFMSNQAAGICLSTIVSMSKWSPSEIINYALMNGTSKAVVAAPRREQVDQGAALFLHAPAALSFQAPRVPGILSFTPATSYVGDGVAFQVIDRDQGSSRLSYSYFHLGGISIDEPLLQISGREVQLSVLPGPKNNIDNDWSLFVGLSWTDETSPPKQLPINAGDVGPFIYHLPSLPWSHLDGNTAALPVTRTAGDDVAIEIPAGKEGAAAMGVASANPARTLVVHEVWYPGWTAEIDGRPARIDIPADKVSWRLPLPPGARRAVFRFVPWDFRIGLAGMLGTALVCFVAFVGAASRPRLRKRSGPGGPSHKSSRCN